MFEKFDPNKFKTIDEIPDSLKKNFVEVSEKGNFIRKEAQENDEWMREKADEVNKTETTQDSPNAKIEAVDLIHENALKEHEIIEKKYSEKISGLEEKLGIGLSDDAKKQIYSQISAEHKVETMSDQEKGDRRDEQELYNNEQIIIKAKDILKMPEEDLMKLPDQQRREMIKDLKWNRFADRFGSNETPDEILEAEAKIYETYKPSDELQAEHMKQADALLETVTNNFKELNDQWSSATVEEREEMCKKWADQLCDGYNIPKINLYSSGHESSGTVAAFQESTDSREPSRVMLSERRLKNGSMKNFLHDLRHEISHAFQKAVREGEQPEEKKKLLANDAEWLKLQKEMEGVRDDDLFKKSNKRYLSLPGEKDAHLADRKFEKKLDDTFSQAEGRVVEEAGLEDLEAIRLNGSIARTARRLIGDRQIIDSNQLLELVKAELSEKAVSLFESVFAGKTGEECFQIIKQFEEKEERVNELLKAA